MPSRDTYHDKNPRTNEWLRDKTRAARRRASVSGVIVALAERLGKTPEAVAEAIPEDTLRRTMYPVTQIEHEDGTIEYRDGRSIVRR